MDGGTHGTPTRGKARGGEDERIADVGRLVAHLEAGCTPAADARIGVEHEKFVQRRSDLSPAPFDGDRGVARLLAGIERHGWEGVFVGDERIGLRRGAAAVSLEPGGQLELAGAPHDSVHAVADELRAHLREAVPAAARLGLELLGLGFHPLWVSGGPTVPKERFGIMRDYMPRVGGHGLDMMFRTCSTQVSVDFASEADMVRKLRLGLALQPLAVALCASSPLVAGRPCGHLSHRSFVWSDTDPARCGIPAFVFEPGMGFERYVDWALDVPMYSVERDGHHVDTAGQSFRDFLRGALPALPGERPCLRDWRQHLQALSPEVRLKRVVEMRGADSGPVGHAAALAAFWTGLLYDAEARGAAWELVSHWSQADRLRLRDAVPVAGLAARTPEGTLGALGRRVLDLAADGLRRRARSDAAGCDESIHLEPFREAVASGRTLAHALLDDATRSGAEDGGRAVARTWALDASGGIGGGGGEPDPGATDAARARWARDAGDG